MKTTINLYLISIIAIVSLIIRIAILCGAVYLGILLIKGLRKYLKSSDVREEKNKVKMSLGEVIKTHRTCCKMTQEFVAESIGVSRQAVSKWESGTSDPSTSNLFALAKLFDVPVEKLLREVKQ